jgi:hypothetical protein
MGATHFLMKTLPRVASEMALHVLAEYFHADYIAAAVRPEHQLFYNSSISGFWIVSGTLSSGSTASSRVSRSCDP